MALCEAQRWLRHLTASQVQQILGSRRQTLVRAGAPSRQLSNLDALRDALAPRAQVEGSEARPFGNPYSGAHSNASVRDSRLPTSSM